MMIKKQVGLICGLTVIVTVVSFLIINNVNANKAEQLAEQLSDNLALEGLPLTSVRVEEQDPLTLEVTLQYPTADSPERKAEILRGRHAVRWNCAELNREKYQISSYIVLILDDAGKQLSWEQNFLYQSDPEEVPAEYTLNLKEAADYLRETFNPGFAQVKRFELIQEQKDSTMINTRYIMLVEPNLQTLNNDLPMRQIEPLINGVNQQKLYQVDICWLEIHGPNSEVWLDYLYDYSFPVVSWWMADGVSTEWFPHPAPLPNQEPTMIAPPEKTYPVETQEPTDIVPYP